MPTKPSTSEKAVIWDMDGVIVDTAPFHFRAWKEAWKERGVPFGESDFGRAFGKRNREIIHTVLGKDTPEDRITEIANSKERYYRQFARGGVVPLPGAVELLKVLREGGFRQAIASSAPAENVYLVLDSLAIRPLFDAVVCEEDVREGKPSPEIFLTAAARLGTEPVNCLVIEDAVAGVRAAKRAGMRCVAVSNSHPPDRLGEADVVVDSLTKLDVSKVREILRARPAVS